MLTSHLILFGSRLGLPGITALNRIIGVYFSRLLPEHAYGRWGS